MWYIGDIYVCTSTVIERSETNTIHEYASISSSNHKSVDCITPSCAIKQLLCEHELDSSIPI